MPEIPDSNAHNMDPSGAEPASAEVKQVISDIIDVRSGNATEPIREDDELACQDLYGTSPKAFVKLELPGAYDPDSKNPDSPTWRAIDIVKFPDDARPVLDGHTVISIAALDTLQDDSNNVRRREYRVVEDPRQPNGFDIKVIETLDDLEGGIREAKQHDPDDFDRVMDEHEAGVRRARDESIEMQQALGMTELTSASAKELTDMFETSQPWEYPADE